MYRTGRRTSSISNIIIYFRNQQAERGRNKQQGEPFKQVGRCQDPFAQLGSPNAAVLCFSTAAEKAVADLEEWLGAPNGPFNALVSNAAPQGGLRKWRTTLKRLGHASCVGSSGTSPRTILASAIFSKSTKDQNETLGKRTEAVSLLVGIWL